MSGGKLGLLWPQSSSIWTAGDLYYENLLTSLGLAGRDDGIVVIEPLGGSFATRAQERFPHVPVIGYEPAPTRRGLGGKVANIARARLELQEPAFRRALEGAQVGAVFGDMDVTRKPPVPWVGWIPDFQHIHYPEFFSTQELEQRDTGYGLLARRATNVLLSSHDALRDFATFAPRSVEKGRVAPFVSLLPDAALDGDPVAVAAEYSIFGPYVVVPNQWWRHKNHEVAIRAAALLRDRGVKVIWVFTGALSDYRSPAHISELLQLIARLRLGEIVTVLGVMPRVDQLVLMRGAECVVQPSLFEGWSTVVEDAKTLGQRIVLSDLGVHREQEPPGAVFFDPRSPQALADGVERMLAEESTLDAVTARAASLERARVFGQTFHDICQSAGEAFQTP